MKYEKTICPQKLVGNCDRIATLNRFCMFAGNSALLSTLASLPSVQPESEMRCAANQYTIGELEHSNRVVTCKTIYLLCLIS